MKQNRKFMFSLAVFLLYSVGVLAQTTNTSGNWSTAGNWSSPSSVPINTSGTCTGGSAASSTCTTPVLVSHAMTLNQNISISTGVYYINNSVTDLAGGTAYTLTMSNASYSATQSILDVKSGTTTFEGAVTLSNATVYVRNGATLVTGPVSTGSASKIVIDAGGTWIVNGNLTDNHTTSGLITVNGYLQVNGNYSSSASATGVRVGPNPATTGAFYTTGTMVSTNASGTIFGSTNDRGTGSSFVSGRALACGASGSAYASVISGGYTQLGACSFVTMTHSVTTGVVASRTWEVSTTGPGSGFSSTGVTTAAYTSAAGQTVNKWYRVAYTISGCSGSPTLYTYPVAQTVSSGTNTWTGATSTDWNTASNWSQGKLPNAVADVVIPSGTTFSPTTPAADLTLKSLTVNSGATLTVAGSYNHKLSCGTGLVNNGTITGTNTNLEFVYGAQTVSGSSKTTFDKLRISNCILTFEANADLVTELSFSGANNSIDFDGVADDKIFTFKSSDDNPDNSARISTVPVGTNILGKVKWERYTTKPAFNAWHMLSFPVTGSTVAQLQPSFSINGWFTGSNGRGGSGSTAFSVSNLRTYDETQLVDDPDYPNGVANLDDGFNRFPLTTNQETFTVGTGYRLFMWITQNPLQSAGVATYTLTGNISTGDVPVTITNTNSSSGDHYNDGWNLLGNPYLSYIDVSANFGNIDKTTNIFSTLSYEDAAYRHYNANTDIGVNGGTKYIAPGQAFWVHADDADGYGSKVLTFTEAMKVESPANAQFFRIASGSGIDNILRLRLLETAAPATTEETVIHFYDGASTAVDGTYDVKVFDNRSNAAPWWFGISSSVSSKELAINALDDSDVTSATVYVNTFGTAGKSMTLKFGEINSFASNIIVRMTDLETSTVRDITFDDSDYVFTAVEDQSSPRFKFEFTTASTPFTLTGHTSGQVSVGFSYYIQGTGFSTTTTDQVVQFPDGSGGYINATITAATTTQLTVTVPAAAKMGYVRVIKDGVTQTMPLPVAINRWIYVNHKMSASMSGPYAKLYYRKNGGAWSFMTNTNSTACNTWSTNGFKPGDVIEFAVEESINGNPAPYYAGVVSGFAVCTNVTNTYGGNRVDHCTSLTRYTYVMPDAEAYLNIVTKASAGAIESCSTQSYTLTVNKKLEGATSQTVNIWTKVGALSFSNTGTITSTTPSSYNITGLKIGQTVRFALEESVSGSSIEYYVGEESTPPDAGDVYSDNRTNSCPTYTYYVYTVTGESVTQNVSLTAKVTSGYLLTCPAVRTMTINLRSAASTSSAANLYYRVNGGSWTYLGASSGTICQDLAITGLATGDVIDFAAENSTDASSIAYQAQISGSCVGSGTTYSDNRSGDCGGPKYSYTVTGTDSSHSIYINVSGSVFVGCM